MISSRIVVALLGTSTPASQLERQSHTQHTHSDTLLQPDTFVLPEILMSGSLGCLVVAATETVAATATATAAAAAVSGCNYCQAFN